MGDVTYSFYGKSALVTGATSGIGRAIAQVLASAGAHVFVNSENETACKETCKGICDAGGRASSAVCDVSNAQALQEMAHTVWRSAGRIDMLFCNAGVTGAKRIGDAGYEADVEKIFAINLHHARLLCEEILPEMAKAGGGSAVLTSSLAGLRGNAGIGVYSLTKAAVAQLARDMAVRWGPKNVRVNAVSPGLIATGWETQILREKEAASRRLRMTPLRRIGQPEEIAAAAVFLASDAAGFITGHNLIVDGGTLITDGI